MTSRDQDDTKDHRFSGGNKYANPNRRMWVSLPGNLDLVLFHIPMEEELRATSDIEHQQGWTPTAILYMAQGRLNKVSVDLTLMTEEEIDSFEEFMTRTFKYAHIYAKERDRRALEAHHAGTAEVLFHRLYRPVPHLVDIAREVFIDSEGVPERPEPTAEDDGSDPSE